MPAPRQKAASPMSKSPSYSARLCERDRLGLGEFSMTEDALGASTFAASIFSGRVIMCQGVTPLSADSGGCSTGGRDCPYRSRGRAPESEIDRPLGSSSWLKSRSAPKSLAVDFLTADEGVCPS